jgi:hypothetical protein
MAPISSIQRIRRASVTPGAAWELCSLRSLRVLRDLYVTIFPRQSGPRGVGAEHAEIAERSRPLEEVRGGGFSAANAVGDSRSVISVSGEP